MVEYSEKLARQVESYLKSQEWKYDFDTEDGVFRFGMNLENKMHSCKMNIVVGSAIITSYAVSHIGADADSMAQAANYLTRANYGLKLGNFELDVRDGEVRYKSALFCGDDVPALKVVERVVDVSFQMMQAYGDGLLSVIFSGADPAQEIAKIED
ncbi:MAG: YbjN domain-containing protein [Oscillospiraceae bacterium]|jgi:hypothetical protein|nr:YbjN domain-containing protein [Oscillospiraceae bacterium]